VSENNQQPIDEFLLTSIRHLHMTRLTLDGNYHANHYAKGKTADQNDTSIWTGRGYFPIESIYNQNCGFQEVSSAEVATSAFLRIRRLTVCLQQKSVCGHLSVVNKQNRSKFKNMDISGIVNCQCCHVFIRSTANLKCAER